MTLATIVSISYENDKQDLLFQFIIDGPWREHYTLVVPHFKKIDNKYMLLNRLKGLNIHLKNKAEFFKKCGEIYL